MRNAVTNATNSPGPATGRAAFLRKQRSLLATVFLVASTVFGQDIPRPRQVDPEKPALSQTSPTPATLASKLAPKYGNLPLSFAANQGQADREVRYLARGRGYGLYLTANEAVLTLSKPAAKPGAKVDILRTKEGRRPGARRINNQDKNFAAADAGQQGRQRNRDRHHPNGARRREPTSTGQRRGCLTRQGKLLRRARSRHVADRRAHLCQSAIQERL